MFSTLPKFSRQPFALTCSTGSQLHYVSEEQEAAYNSSKPSRPVATRCTAKADFVTPRDSLFAYKTTSAGVSAVRSSWNASLRDETRPLDTKNKPFNTQDDQFLSDYGDRVDNAQGCANASEIISLTTWTITIAKESGSSVQDSASGSAAACDAIEVESLDHSSSLERTPT